VTLGVRRGVIGSRATRLMTTDENPETLPTGQKMFGKYRAFAKLGSGGMGDVFLAIARGLRGVNKLVVIKSLKHDLDRDQQYIDMFLDEARLAARLNHPNVVHIFDVDEADGDYFIAMEFLEGQSLKEILDHVKEKEAPFGPAIAARVVSDALLGLHYAHELCDYDGRPLQIIHRDISPHNVFVTYEGQVKLVDFGIAKSVSRSTENTQAGVLKGKLAYMSPEQALGEPMDRRADIYAMGIVLWEALTLTSIAQGETPLTRVLREVMPRASSVVPDLDPELDDLVARSLETDPAKRFQTAAEMREALEAWIVRTAKVVRQEDIGQRLRGMFEGVRAELDRKVKDQMAAAVVASSLEDLSLPSIRVPVSARAPVPVDAHAATLTTQASPVRPSAASTGTASGVGVTVEAPRSGGVRGVVGAALAVGLAGFVALGWAKMRSSSSSEVAASGSSAAAAPSAASAEIDEGRLESFGPLPAVISAHENPLSDEKIALGRMLFYDARLSTGTESTASRCRSATPSSRARATLRRSTTRPDPSRSCGTAASPTSRSRRRGRCRRTSR
jgi:serine/threonine-protein kinase